MSKLDGKSMDILEENSQQLQQLFPEIITDGQVNFDMLKQVLGDYTDDTTERYNFTWNGKGQALRNSQTPSMGTLRPSKSESKEWDSTENLYIEGDNLEVLKLLQKSYFGKVKMIYIDPPYNTGGDFVYKDDFKDSLKNYKEITGQVDGNGNATTTNREYSGRYHTDWLNMMYPRLRLARNLLTDDGVIFISIDDNEQANLKKICDEVFGEENFVTQFLRKGSGGRQDSTHYAEVHEYILCYAKNSTQYTSGKELSKLGNFPLYDTVKKKKYKTQLLRKWGENSRRSDRPNLFYPITGPDGKGYYPMLTEKEEGCWRWGKAKMIEALGNENVEFIDRGGTLVPYEKIYEPSIGELPTKLFTTWIDSIGVASGTPLVRELLEGKYFDYPKPVKLISYIVNLSGASQRDIILDFFSGSATTAHAVMQLNAEDGGNRKFIMVQLPEETDEKSEAYKAGYRNIAEIGKERIRRAGEQIKKELTEKHSQQNLEENPIDPKSLDIGFKVLKLDTSNIKPWNPGDYKDIQTALADNVSPYIPGRSEEDVVFELILKMGLSLTYPIKEYKAGASTIYSIGFGALMICLSDTEPFSKNWTVFYSPKRMKSQYFTMF